MRNAIRHCASGCQLMASAAEGVQGRSESNSLSLGIAITQLKKVEMMNSWSYRDWHTLLRSRLSFPWCFVCVTSTY